MEMPAAMGLEEGWYEVSLTEENGQCSHPAGSLAIYASSWEEARLAAQEESGDCGIGSISGPTETMPPNALRSINVAM